MKPRLLDLYSYQGGAGMGYHRAGFDVVGVDLEPQPRYPFEHHVADALEFLAEHGHEFDAVHASPPCQDHSKLAVVSGVPHGTGWLLAATREALIANGKPWIIENVPGAPMRADYRLCGCMFDLGSGQFGLRRERWFETSWRGYELRQPCSHQGYAITVTGHGAQGRDYKAGRAHTVAEAAEAMGIDWMTRDGLAQAIPPAFTEYLGAILLAELEQVAA